MYFKSKSRFLYMIRETIRKFLGKITTFKAILDSILQPSAFEILEHENALNFNVARQLYATHLFTGDIPSVIGS